MTDYCTANIVSFKIGIGLGRAAVERSISQRYSLVLITGLISCLAFAPDSVRADDSTLTLLPSRPFAVSGGARSSIDTGSDQPLAVSLPGQTAPTDLYLVERNEISVPVFDASGNLQKEVGAVVDTVSDLKQTYGSLVHLTQSPESGVRGVLGNASGEPGSPSWHIEPIATYAHAGAGLHEVSLVENTETADTSCSSPLAQSSASQTEFQALRQLRIASAQSAPLPSTPATWRQIDLIVIAPGDFTSGRSELDVISQIVSTIAAANLYYEPLGLVINLAGVQLFRSGSNDPYAQATAQRDSLAMLETARFQWAVRTVPDHDVVAVFARSPFSGIFGLAYPAASCIVPEFSFLFVTQGRSGAAGEIGLVGTLAHELGHVIGMNHDNTVTAGGPSMMWPFFVLQPTGFSDISTNEFLKHSENGGTQCFAQTEIPVGIDAPPPSAPGPFAFAPQTIAPIPIEEGGTVRRTFVANGALGPVFFRASGLPVGAQLNPSTGVLTFSPTFDEVAAVPGSKNYEIIVSAVTSSQSITANVLLTVTDRNRAPKVIASLPLAVEVEQGSTLDLFALAADFDLGDAATIQLTNSRETGRYPGRPVFSPVGNFGQLRWTIPDGTLGTFRFVLQATDLAGAADVQTVLVTVVPENAAPVLTAPDTVEVAAAEAARVKITAADPEGAAVTFDFMGLPPGAVVDLTQGTADITYVPSGSAAEQLRIEVSAFDGNKAARAVVKINILAGQRPAALRALVWPGTDQSQSQAPAVNGIELYNAVDGYWNRIGCDGQMIESVQFGGLIGDVPVAVKLDGQRLRAVYRVVAGQGYWVIQNGSDLQVFPWGLAHDIPVPGDFDGDGETDLAVYRPESSEWYILFSLLPAQVLRDTVLGADSGNVLYPTAADIDGDGFDDRVIISRKADGTALAHVWTAGGRKLVFAVDQLALTESLQPVVADLDADGRADFAVRKSTGGLGLLMSKNAAASKVSNAGPEIVPAECAQGRLALLNNAAFNFLSLGGTVSVQQTALPINTLSRNNTNPMLAQARRSYQMTRGITGDIDLNGASDLAVYRGNTAGRAGQWYLDHAGAVTLPVLPLGGGYPVSGNFFGEEAPRIGVFSSGQWYLQSPGTAERVVTWGEVGDVPVPGDYNADGVDELAVFRPEDSSWWIQFIAADGTARPLLLFWGEEGDVPVPADYDGDGATDIAVWRPSDGAWFVRYLDGRIDVFAFGLSGDTPIPGDYLGTGRASFTVWRPEDGTWYIAHGESAVAGQWGLSNDIPLTGDYNGDGRRDLAVWRPETGTWYVRPLDSFSDLPLFKQFGLPGDLPLGSADAKRVY